MEVLHVAVGVTVKCWCWWNDASSPNSRQWGGKTCCYPPYANLQPVNCYRRTFREIRGHLAGKRNAAGLCDPQSTGMWCQSNWSLSAAPLTLSKHSVRSWSVAGSGSFWPMLSPVNMQIICHYTASQEIYRHQVELSPTTLGTGLERHTSTESRGWLQQRASGRFSRDGYRALYESARITKAARMAHARGKSTMCVKERPPISSQKLVYRRNWVCHREALVVRGCSAEQHLAARKTRAVPLMQSLKMTG